MTIPQRKMPTSLTSLLLFALVFTVTALAALKSGDRLRDIDEDDYVMAPRLWRPDTDMLTERGGPAPIDRRAILFCSPRSTRCGPGRWPPSS